LVAQSFLSPASVVEDLNIFEDGLAVGFAGRIESSVYDFFLEDGEDPCGVNIRGGNIMIFKKYFIIIISLMLLSGCSQSITSASKETGTVASTAVSTAGESQQLKNLDPVDTFSFIKTQEKFMANCYNGIDAGSPYIKNMLDKMAKKMSLQIFSASIKNVQKTNDSKFTLVINKVEVNPKFELGANNTQPFLINKKADETIDVNSDVYFVLNQGVLIQMDEKLNQYIGPSDARYFDFYTCDGDVLFILEGLMP